MRRRAALLLSLSLAGSLASYAEDSSRHLVLVTIDTLRADYLSCNGASLVQTPNLDRLASAGVNFTRTRTPVPLTLPAHASILTGHYPPTHGVRDNGSFRLADEQTTLTEILHGEGYRTAAFVGSFVLDARFGLEQGFEDYEDSVWSEVEEMESLVAERPGEEVLAAFADWLGVVDQEQPFFAWIHLYDPHAPFEAPEPFRSSYPESPYAGEVAYTDHVVGRILERLEAKGVLPRTIVAVVGDHGEGLGEHGEGTHSLLIYNSTLHVPMLIRAPGLIPEGRRVDDLVRTIDLAPTLLDYLGFNVGLGEGRSLRSRIEGSESSDPGLSAYSESLYPQFQLGWSPLRGLESGDHKLIAAPEPELFRLDLDPDEGKNLARIEPAIYQRLKRELVELLAAIEEPEVGVERTADPETEAKLRSLGYLSGGSQTSTVRRGPAVDPKDRMQQWDRIQQGVAQFSAQDYRAAVQSFEAVLADDSEILMAYEYLGSSLDHLAESAQAEGIYLRALGKGLESAELHRQLGRLYLERGDLEKARRELEIALVMDPRSVQAHFEVARIHRQAGRLTQAAEHYRSAVELNPDYIWGWNGLGMVLAAKGEMNEASQVFQRVVMIDPDGAAGYFNLAVHLGRMQKSSDAIDAYERFLELAQSEEMAAQREHARAEIERLSR